MPCPDRQVVEQRWNFADSESGVCPRTPDPLFWRNRRVVVTGATGFLGWHLVQLLRQLKARVRTLALHPPLRHPLLALRDLEPVFGDVLDDRLVASVLTDAEVVFHAAGPVAVWGISSRAMLDTHIRGTLNILRYSPVRARIVYTSSVTTIGCTRTAILLDEETRIVSPGSQLAYIEAKRTSEELCYQAAGTGRWVTIVNPAYLIGPEDFGPSILGRFCQRFWKGRIWLVPHGGINIVDVRDVALGHVLAAEHGRSGQRYILAGHNRSFLEFCRELATVANYRPRMLTTCPTLLLKACAAVAHAHSWWTGREPYPSFGHVQIGSRFWYYTSQRACRELGYIARPLRETLEDTWAWYRQYHRPVLRTFQRWWLRSVA